MCALVQNMQKLVQPQNEIQRRALKRITKAVSDLATGRRVIATRRLPWRFLPPGKMGIKRVVSEFRRRKQFLPDYEVDEERLAFMESLGADETYVGRDSFEGYICFYFIERKIGVLECPFYGNALYILTHDWQTLSKFTKTELLEQFSASVETIRHTRRFQHYVRRKLGDLGVPAPAPGSCS